MTGNSDKNQSNLGDLISRIKSEGIEAASEKAEEIIDKAKAEAEGIVAEARARAEEIIATAHKEAEESEHRGLESLRLASRDSVIILRRSLEELFRSVILKECNEALTGEALQSLITKIVGQWSEGNMDSKGLDIVISEKDLKKLSDSFISKLGKTFEKGVDIKGRKELKGGFRAGIKEADMYYDFSDEAVAELLFNNLVPELAHILNERGNKEESR